MTVEYNIDDCIKCGARCRAGTGSSGPGTALFAGVISINVNERMVDEYGKNVDVYENRRVCADCARVVKDALMELLGFEFLPLSEVCTCTRDKQFDFRTHQKKCPQWEPKRPSRSPHTQGRAMDVPAVPPCTCGSNQPNNRHPVFHTPGCMTPWNSYP